MLTKLVWKAGGWSNAADLVGALARTLDLGEIHINIPSILCSRTIIYDRSGASFCNQNGSSLVISIFEPIIPVTGWDFITYWWSPSDITISQELVVAWIRVYWTISVVGLYLDVLGWLLSLLLHLPQGHTWCSPVTESAMFFFTRVR